MCGWSSGHRTTAYVRVVSGVTHFETQGKQTFMPCPPGNEGILLVTNEENCIRGCDTYQGRPKAVFVGLCFKSLP